MGLDLGLETAGLQVAVSQDFDKWCVETIEANNHKAILGDIRKLIAHDPSCDFLFNDINISKEDVFAVVGGPPCQAYSTAGKRRGEDDERGQLYQQFVHVVNSVKPRFFIMENVKGLSSMMVDKGTSKERPLLDIILKEFKDIGYHTVHDVVDAVHYGTPQFRERLIIIGSRDNEPVYIPMPTHFHFHQNPTMRWKTIGDALDGLDSVGPCGKLPERIQKYLKLVPEGGNWKSLPQNIVEEAMGGAYKSGGGKVGFFRRLSFNEPSPTLVTSPTQKATLLGHPRELRPLSVREYARIQGFPDDWSFKGSITNCYKQIGNAVPIPLGKAIGEMLRAVALGNSQVHSKRMRGTSVHNKLKDIQSRRIK
ncbi:DNA cytosine methyltransferase [Kangiella japonica]|uniref:DNA (cytosine-5-)-methyltransferase n=2 Tax=Kangiella japonica TaxID=647384 RepID=A0ABN0T1T5_9GAMM